jgi:tetratricopeptide (TPR) repeat protein
MIAVVWLVMHVVFVSMPGLQQNVLVLSFVEAFAALVTLLLLGLPGFVLQQAILRRGMRHYRQGAYGPAQQVFGWLWRVEPTNQEITRVYTDALIAGHAPAQAEHVALEVLRNSSFADMPLTLVQFSEALLAQGRSDEAVNSFVALHDSFSSSSTGSWRTDLSGLSQVYLKKYSLVRAAEARAYLAHGTQPDHALSLLKQAVDEGQGLVQGTMLIQIKLDYAWALALAGRTADAQELLEQGMAGVDQQSRPARAWASYRVGQVLTLHGSRTDARNAFREAMELDPDGYVGMLAREAAGEL